MKKENIKVSVVVPVYNVEYYLEECLDSILNQDLEDIEVICVDDGSTDRTPEILKWYERKYDKITVIWQKNRFAGVARNNGLSYAKGEYVIFWDSDDIFHKDALSKMYFKAQKTDSELCICNVENYDNANCKVFKKFEYTKMRFVPSKEVFSYKDVTDHIFEITTPSIWKILIKRELLVKHTRLRFEETKRANDLRFFGMIMATAKRITVLNVNLIQYRVGLTNNLQSNHSDDPISEYYSLKQIKEYLIEENCYEELRYAFNRFIVKNLRHSLKNKRDRISFEKLRETILSDNTAIITYEEILELNEEDFTLCKELIEYLSEPIEEFFPVKDEGDSVIAVYETKHREEKAISVIVTVYNDEKYILTALESVISQNYNNYELVIVNDGAVDNSTNICRNFISEHKDKQIVYIEQKNSGVSEARNNGIKYARGKYIRFLDGDDCIAPNCLSRIVSVMEERNLDILLSGIYPFKDEEAEGLDETLSSYMKYYERSSSYSLVVTGKEMFTKNRIRGEFIMSVGSQAFRRELIDKNRLLFEPDIYHEDDLFSFDALMVAERVMVIKDKLLNRRVRENSIMTMASQKKLIKRGKDRLKIGYMLFERYAHLMGTCNDSRFDVAVGQFIDRQISEGIRLLNEQVSRDSIRDIIREYSNKNPIYYAMLMNVFETRYKNWIQVNEIRKLRNSKSWKITKWLRKLRKLL